MYEPLALFTILEVVSITAATGSSISNAGFETEWKQPLIHNLLESPIRTSETISRKDAVVEDGFYLNPI